MWKFRRSIHYTAVGKYFFFGTLIFSAISLLNLPVSFNWMIGRQPATVQSLAALPVVEFSILYALFVTSALLSGWLFASARVRAIISCVIAVVVLGFWSVHSPTGIYEDGSKVVNNVVIDYFGHINALKYGTYLSFPSTFLLGSSFSFVTDISGLNMLIPLVLSYASISALLLYTLAFRVLKNSFYSLLVVFSFIEGNVQLATYQYHPDYLAIYLVLMFAFALLLPSDLKSNAFQFLLMFASITTDLSAALVILLLSVANYAYQRMKGKATRWQWTTLLLYSIIIVSWMAYWGVLVASYLITAFSTSLRNPLIGFSHVAGVLSSNSAGASQEWTSLIRLVWIGLLVVLPLAIMIAKNVMRSKPLGISGLLFLSSIIVGLGAILGQGGINYFVTLLYAPIGGALILFEFSKGRKLLTLSLIVFLLLMATPSFLAFNERITTFQNPPQLYTSAQFLDSYNFGEGLIFTSNYAALYYNLNAIVVYPPEVTGNFNASTLNIIANSYISEFSRSTGSYLLLYITYFDNYYHLYGQKVGQSIETNTSTILSKENLLYSDGFATIYISSGVRSA